MTISNKKKKAIIRGFPAKSVKQLSAEFGFSEREIKSVLKEEGKLSPFPRKKAAYLAVAATVAVAFLLGSYFYFFGGAAGNSAGGENNKEDAKPVLLIGIDGLAWRVITPLMHGKEYPWIKWFSPLDLPSGPFEYLQSKGAYDTSAGKARFKNGILSINRADMPKSSWGVFKSFNRGTLTGERARFKAEARSFSSGSELTLAVRFHFPGGGKVSDSGNNETVWKSYKLTEEWREVSLEFQLPTTARQFSLIILPYGGDSEKETLPSPGSQPMESQKAEVRNLLLQPGNIRGLPEKGYDFSKLKKEDNLIPHLTRLIKNGSYGLLANINPAISPVIWTSIATGESPSKHGIKTFFMQAPGVEGKVLASSSLRKVPALWNVITDYGDDSVGVAGWWASWPAEKVDGFVISDHANDTALKIMQDREWMPDNEEVIKTYGEYNTYPPELMNKVQSHFIDADEITRQELSNFIPRLDTKTWNKFQKIDRVKQSIRLSRLKYYYARDKSLHQAIKYMWKQRNPDLWMIYYQGADIVEHAFWHFEDPAIFPRVDREKAEKYGSIVEEYYRFMDRAVGELMDKAGPDATYILVSDHGHYPVDFMQARKDGPHGHHRWRCPGVFIGSGPAIKKNNYLTEASIFDVAPTVLYIMDYPVASNLEGRVLQETIRPGWADSHPIKNVPRYEYKSSRSTGKTPLRSRFNTKVKDRLKAVGYLQ
ncbi:MAG: alkaline phosphatase family protein [bacterium]